MYFISLNNGNEDFLQSRKIKNDLQQAVAVVQEINRIANLYKDKELSDDITPRFQALTEKLNEVRHIFAK